MKALILVLVSICFGINAYAKDLPGDSIYQIGQNWVTQDGNEIPLASLRGQPVLLSMVYLSCQYICPTIISEVQGLEKKLDPKTREKVKVVLVSFDPKRDTPSVMNAYAKKRGLDSKKWIFITHKRESKIRELSAALDFKYKWDGKSDFTHSFLIAVLDQEGKIRARVDSANQDKKELIETLNSLSK